MNNIINIDTAIERPDLGETGWKVGNLGAGQMRSDLSKQWFARPHDQRFLDLGDMRDHLRDRRERSEIVIVDNKDLNLIAPNPTVKSDLQVLGFGVEAGSKSAEGAVTNWTFGQVSGLAKAPAGYLKTLPSQIVADNLNWGLRQSRDKEKVKVYWTTEDDGQNLFRAITGPDYGRIFDVELVEAVMNVAGLGIGDARWKVPGVMDWSTMIYNPNTPITKESTTLFASDRDVFIFLVDDRNPIEIGKLPDGSPDIVFRGFYVTNSEVGAGTLKVCVFYLRAICCNRLLWGVEGFEEISIRHSKYAPDRFVESARPALEAFADRGTQSLIEGVQKAKAAKVVDDDAEAVAWLQARNFSKRRALDIIEIVEKEEQTKPRTVWDFAQGITAIARNEPNNDSRVDLERAAGKLLDKVA